MSYNKKASVQRQNGHAPNKNDPKDKMLKFVPKDTSIHEADEVLMECRLRNSQLECCHCDRRINGIEVIDYRCDRCRNWDDEITGHVCKNCYYACPNPKLMSYGLQRIVFGGIVWD